MKYYLYNPLSNNGIRPEFQEGIELVEVIGLDYKKFFDELKEEDEVVLVGGDGTINYFINAIDTNNLKNNVYYKPAGTGNDFLRDLEQPADKEILLNEYLKNLPTVYVNGMERKFINGIGFGIDGYCCEVADKIKAEKPNAKINYTSIAIKGLLFHFKPCHATISVDGVVEEYDNVWIAPAMKGRFYGGGMNMAPTQNRLDGDLSSVVYMSKSKFQALIVFPSIFKGEHVKKEKMVKIIKGKEIEVTFSRPCALQIDGETVLDVLTYKVKA